MQESEREFRSIVFSSPDAIVIADGSGKILFMNPAAKRTLKQTVGDAFGFPLVDQSSTEVPLCRLEKESRVGEMQVTEIEWLRTRAHLLMIHDITECKKMEERMDQFETIIETSSSAIGMFTLKGNPYYQNKAFDRLFGEETTTSIKTYFVDEKVKRAIFQAILDGGEWRKEVEMYGKEKKIHNILVHVIPLKEAHGKVIGFLGFFNDTIEMKKAEKAQRLSDQKIRAVFDEAYQFIGLLTPEGIVLETNKTAREFAGIDESDCLGKPFWDTPWWTHSAEMQNMLREAVNKARQGETVVFEATHLARDGTLHYVDFSLKPFRDENGDVLFLVPEGRDITERKKIEEDLRDQMRDMDVLLDATMDREIKMIELKEKIKSLEEQLRVKD